MCDDIQYADEIARRLRQLVIEYRDRLKRRTISRNTMFREYLSGRPIFNEELNAKILERCESGGVGVIELIDSTHAALRTQREFYNISGVSVGLAGRQGVNLEKVFIFSYDPN